MEALDIFNIVKAVVSIGLGIAKSVNEIKVSKAQAKADAEQAQELVNERARKAQKLIQMQKTAFLKSGVYFEGSPEAIFNETYDFAKQDISAIANDSYNRQKQLIRQGRTAFATNMVNAFGGAANSLSEINYQNLGKTFSNSTLGTNLINTYNKIRGWNRGGFGYPSGDKIV